LPGQAAAVLKQPEEGMRVSVLSIVFMAVSALASTGLPVVLFIVFHKKYGGKFIPLLTGAAAFIIFALLLENSIHSVVLGASGIRNMPAAYIIYGVLMAGLFEETARFLSFSLLKKKYAGVGTGLSYGAGHGGIEAILLAGIAMTANLVFSLMINAGNAEILTKNPGGESLAQLNTQMGALAAAEPYMFLLAGIERVFALGIQIPLSVIVYYSVYAKNKRYLYPLAVVIHALVDVPAMLAQTGIIKQMIIVEVLAGVSAVLLIILAAELHKKMKGEEAGLFQNPVRPGTAPVPGAAQIITPKNPRF
jgi:uncharacterized membrane protein YhfC